MTSRWSVRGRITAVATALVAITLVLISIVIVQLVEDDVSSAATSALVSALEDQAISFEADEGTQAIFDVFVEGELLELGLFTQEEFNDVALGELYQNGIPVALVEIDLETERVLGLFDPFTGGELRDPDLLATLNQLDYETLDVDGDEGSQLLVGAQTFDEIEAATSAVRRALFITVPLLVLSFALLIWWLVGRALRPVHAITAQVQDISTGSLHQRVPAPGGKDEVAELATVMNKMLGRLEEGDERQRQFSADASHELRSPLSTVRAAAEIIEQRPNSERTGELAGDIVAESDRMNDLIGSLLELAHLDESSAPSKTSVDLGALTSMQLDGSEVSLEVQDNVLVSGDAGQLRRMVRNLVDNAERHAASSVRVQVRRVGGNAELAVEDDGQGVAADQRDRIFERFTRLDEARARGQGGSGLGLSLVKSIVDRHHGSIDVDESLDLGGARFVVRLPSA